MAWLYRRNGIAYVGRRDVRHKQNGRSLRTRNRRVAATRFRWLRIWVSVQWHLW